MELFERGQVYNHVINEDGVEMPNGNTWGGCCDERRRCRIAMTNELRDSQEVNREGRAGNDENHIGLQRGTFPQNDLTSE